MKKLLTLLLSALLILTSAFAVGCADEPEKGKVNINYYKDGSFIVSAIVAGEETIGLVPEPAASALEKQMKAQNKDIYRLDLQELYDSQTKSYPQAVLMVKKSVLGAHSDLVSTLENKITESANWIKTNTSAAVAAINANGGSSLKAPALNENAINGCNIYWQSAESAKTSVKNYINKIVDIDSEKATAVKDDFFYSTAQGTNTKESYTFVMPDGAPALAAAKLINDSDNLGTGKNIDYQVEDASQISLILADGACDFIIAPVNVASKLYKKSGADHYVMVAVLTHGNFYIMSTEQITVNDLVGKQVAVPMKGAVPDWTFKMVLKKYGISCVTVE